MFAAVLSRQPAAKADGVEILEIAWVSQQDVAGLDLAPDMAEIIPASFAWVIAR